MRCRSELSLQTVQLTPSVHRSLEVVVGVAAYAVALESYGAVITAIVKCPQKASYIECAAVQRLNQSFPVFAASVGAVYCNHK